MPDAREACLKTKSFSAVRMLQHQLPSQKIKSVVPGLLPPDPVVNTISVNRVSDDRMGKALQVTPDLVPTARNGLSADQ